MIIHSGNIQGLLHIQQALHSLSTDPESLPAELSSALEKILEIFACSNGRVLLSGLDHARDFLIEVVDGALSTRAGPAVNYENQGVESVAIESNTAQRIDNTLASNDWNPAAHQFTAAAPSSAIVAPLRYGDDWVGAITLIKPGPGQFSRQDLLLLSYIAAQFNEALTALELRRALQSAENSRREPVTDNQDLAAILVHDLQGPLANVVTSLEMVQEAVNQTADEELAPIVEIAVRSSQQLQDLVDSLLDIGRLEAGHAVADLESVTVCDLLDYVTEIESPLIEQRQVMLVREIAPGLPQVLVNKGIIERVLLNLLDNALKVSKREQTITIHANEEAGSRFVRICVVDQGPGIPRDYSERVFEKYQRIPGASTSKGLGLGLAFCRLAVEAHGGRIWVKNNADEGACFCFTLPTAAEAADSS